jgi:hypothetical protein
MAHQEDRDLYAHNGYLHVRSVFSPRETDELAEDLDRLIEDWSFEGAWTGPWREAYLDPELAATISLLALHDLQLYSAAWARAITHPRLVEVLASLLGPQVEFHHTTMHVKPPERGAPFPMHQDQPFYPHADDRYVDVLLHLDDTSHHNGEIRFLAGSHRSGPLEHITESSDGRPCTPHPSDRPLPAGGRRGGPRPARRRRVLQHQHRARVVPESHRPSASSGQNGIPASGQPAAERTVGWASGGDRRRRAATRPRNDPLRYRVTRLARSARDWARSASSSASRASRLASRAAARPSSSSDSSRFSFPLSRSATSRALIARLLA